VHSSRDHKKPRRANAVQVLWVRLKKHPLARLGPGLITGVADDDPSGIATCSQAGAQFGLNMLWTLPLAYPLMAAIQAMCAQIGRVTGEGLAANIKTAFPPIVLKGVVLLLLIANTLNIAADVAAMGEVAELVTGAPRHLMTAFFVIVTLLLQIFVPYHRYVFFLKWLTLSLLAYAAVLFTVHVPWGDVALRTVWPKLTLNSETAAVVVGVFGTTITVPWVSGLKTLKTAWNDDSNRRVLELAVSGASAARASAALNRSISAVRMQASKLGTPFLTNQTIKKNRLAKCAAAERTLIR